MLLKNVISGYLLVMLAGSMVAQNPSAQGVVEGHVHISPLSSVERADDAATGSTTIKPPYSEYPLIVRSADGEKEVARITADPEGNYRVSLPPGDYVLDVERRGPTHLRAGAQQFTIIAGKTIHVDIDIDTGIR